MHVDKESNRSNRAKKQGDKEGQIPIMYRKSDTSWGTSNHLTSINLSMQVYYVHWCNQQLQTFLEGAKRALMHGFP